MYEREGGYAALRKVLGGMTPADVVEVVKESGLRGRGGAGFPTGMKWGFVPKDAAQVYFMINADESEPGTFKDRYLMDYDPHLMLEGTIIGAFAVRSNLAVIYIRGEYGWLIDRTQAAVDEAYAAGYLGKNILGSGYDLEVIVHKGAGAYICGEETGLINSVTGRKGQPTHQAAVPGRRAASWASRPSSTTSRRWPPCPGSSSTAPRPTRRSAPRSRPGPSSGA